MFSGGKVSFVHVAFRIAVSVFRLPVLCLVFDLILLEKLLILLVFFSVSLLPSVFLSFLPSVFRFCLLILLPILCLFSLSFRIDLKKLLF